MLIVSMFQKVVHRMSKKEKRIIKQIEKLENFVGVDLCACNGLRCDGVCRDNHTKNGEVVCPSLYQIDISELENKLKKLNRAEKHSRTEKEESRERFFQKNVDRH